MSETISKMSATDSNSVKRSVNAHFRVKKGRNMINTGDCSVIIHGYVSSKRTESRKRKRSRQIGRYHSRGSGSPSVPARRGFNRGGPQLNALRDKNWLNGLTDANVAQLPEQSRHSFSIPTADIEEATAVLSGSGISINQRAHLRDINSCMSALLYASRIGLNHAMENLVLERDGLRTARQFPGK